ncbi:MAG: hypothetical protein KGJ30_11525 [Burkholderiales bacterium]|nr:hypothetical protein [Burkholderiales bacterium]
MQAPFKRPWTVSLPILMSGVAIALVLAHAALYGTVHEPDEGAAAHLFQVLMVGQWPLLAYFFVRRFPRSPRRFGAELVLLAALWIGSFAAVRWLT